MNISKSIHLNRFSIKVLVFTLSILAIIFRVIVAQATWMHYDENYYLNIAQNYMNHRELTPYMWRLGDLHILSGGGSGYGILVLVAWQYLVNNSLFGGRVIMIFIGVLSAIIMYFVAKSWWHSHLAGLTALVFGFVGTAPFYTLILKMDAIAILSFTLLLLLFVYTLEHDRWFLHFALGVLTV
jgi:hypothetical protein